MRIQLPCCKSCTIGSRAGQREHVQVVLERAAQSDKQRATSAVLFDVQVKYFAINARQPPLSAVPAGVILFC